LGFLPNAASNSTPFFANLVKSGTLASNIFSFYMTRGGVDGSELYLGCVNSEKYTGEITYHPVVMFTEDGQPFEWGILSAGLSYESSQGRTSRRSNRKTWISKAIPATIDSGTTFIYVPNEIAKELYDQVKQLSAASEEWDEGVYAFPCSSADDMGTISFGFGDKQYAINPRDFNAGPESE
ncbi:Type I transmembrane sorting receptor, partial [Tulasnella sp. UAMH 9824]